MVLNMKQKKKGRRLWQRNGDFAKESCGNREASTAVAAWRFPLVVLALVLLLTGCGLSLGREENRTALDFTVVDSAKIPEELKKVMEEHKEEEMQLVFADGANMYAVRGYGKQDTGGYSIAVDECTEGEEHIYIATTLIGPSQMEGLSQDPSYPVIVLKLESRDKEVIFE